MTKSSLILVDAQVLPEVFTKVLKAKKLIADDECTSIGDAAKAAGISRSAFYKYKDFVFPFNHIQGIITLSFILSDVTGVLSSILNILAESNANVLTINQNIPVNSLADVTICIQSDYLTGGLEELVDKLSMLSGVKDVKVLARQ
ncbi:MAG: ACT domain-containing protein [Bacillota bacterium]|nr:ACT domain-containing protein [Bacillota bacterium]